MTDLKTKTYKNNPKAIEGAENDMFSWDNDIDRDTLTHKPSGRQIYQMHWINDNGKMAERVEGELSAAVIEFWKALSNAQKTIKQTPVATTTKPKGDWYHYNEYGERELNEDY